MKASISVERDIGTHYWLIHARYGPILNSICLTLEEACELRDLLKKRLPVDATWDDDS